MAGRPEKRKIQKIMVPFWNNLFDSKKKAKKNKIN